MKRLLLFTWTKLQGQNLTSLLYEFKAPYSILNSDCEVLIYSIHALCTSFSCTADQFAILKLKSKRT